MSTKNRARYVFEKEMGPMTFGTFLTSVRTTNNMTQIELEP